MLDFVTVFGYSVYINIRTVDVTDGQSVDSQCEVIYDPGGGGEGTQQSFIRGGSAWSVWHQFYIPRTKLHPVSYT